MALILNIETATKNCSVSIAREGRVIAIKELADVKYSHAEKLHPFIVEAISTANIQFKDLDAIAVSKGPGSYTGLRIGVSAAKGFAFAFKIPLISVSTLKALAMAAHTDEGFIVPMLDARRMEVYAAVFDPALNQVREIKAEVINEDSFQEYLLQGPVCFLGDGAEKCKEILVHDNAFFLNDLYPSAKEMATLSYEKYSKNNIEDVAYFEPFYLKDFIANSEKSKF